MNNQDHDPATCPGCAAARAIQKALEGMGMSAIAIDATPTIQCQSCTTPLESTVVRYESLLTGSLYYLAYKDGTRRILCSCHDEEPSKKEKRKIVGVRSVQSNGDRLPFCLFCAPFVEARDADALTKRLVTTDKRQNVTKKYAAMYIAILLRHVGERIST